ncbi:RICIN domain-containing protein [Streptomyces sp. NPDC058301]|uniref:RICIN domain-containing protein n=1 Tax=Streptomyces sp. NPDC058301 TaxID=3346436 RepID=UPI0036EE4F6C
MRLAGHRAGTGARTAVAIGIAGLLALVGTSPAHATPRLYRIKNANSGQCLAVGAASKAGGAGVIQWTCVPGAVEQLWYFDGPWYVNGVDFYRIINWNSGMCLADPASSTNAGVQMIQYGCGSGHEQFWRADTPDTFRNLASSLRLAVGGRSQTPGAPVVQWYPNSQSEQSWEETPP